MLQKSGPRSKSPPSTQRGGLPGGSGSPGRARAWALCHVGATHRAGEWAPNVDTRRAGGPQATWPRVSGPPCTLGPRGRAAPGGSPVGRSWRGTKQKQARRCPLPAPLPGARQTLSCRLRHKKEPLPSPWQRKQNKAKHIFRYDLPTAHEASVQSEVRPVRPGGAAGVTPACASWSPSPRPPPGGPPHSRAGTPGSAEGPRRPRRRAPAGGRRRSPWRVLPAGKGRGHLCGRGRGSWTGPRHLPPGAPAAVPCTGGPAPPPVSWGGKGWLGCTQRPRCSQGRGEQRSGGPQLAGGWATGRVTLHTECFR